VIHSEQKTAIRATLQDFRQQGLKNFVEEFLVLLQQEGFSFQDLLAALASLAHEQPNSQLLVRFLEDAATEAQRVSSR